MKKKAGESTGIYLNPRNDSFQQALNNQIYVDKSLLIDYTNQLIGTVIIKYVYQDLGALENLLMLICLSPITLKVAILKNYLIH